MSVDKPTDTDDTPQSAKGVTEAATTVPEKSANTRNTAPKSEAAFKVVGAARVFKRLPYLALHLVGEVTAVILGLGFAWLCAVNILIAQRVMDVSFLKADAARLFSSAFEGKSADVGQMTLTWEAADNTVIFQAKDIFVDDKDGVRLNAIAGIETELALRDVAQGRLDPLRVVIDGGDLSFVRDKDGNFIGGLGTPATVGALGPIWRGEKNDGDNDLEIGRLRSIDIRNAKIHVEDAGSDYKAQLTKAKMDIAFSEETITFDLRSDLTVAPDGAANRAFAPIQLQGTMSPDLENFDAAVMGTDFNPSKLLPDIKHLRPLRLIDAPLEFNIQSLAARGAGLQKLDVSLNAGQGSIIRDESKTPFNSGQLIGSYDPALERLDVTTLEIDCEPLALRGTAQLSNIGTPAQGMFSKNTGFSSQLETLRWDAAQTNIDPIAVTDVQIAGEIMQETRQVRFDDLRANFGSFAPRLSALLTRSEAGKLTYAQVGGRIDGTVSKAQLLSLWPEGMMLGGRWWIDNSIIAATLSNIDVDFKADEHVLSGQPLRNSDLNVTFDLAEGQLRYISTMTPITNITGRGILLGNQIEFFLDSGQIDDVKVGASKVTIPKVFPYGEDMIIEGVGSGPVTTFIGLLDQKPFEYVTPYGVSPADFTGQADVKLRVTRPLRRQVKYEQIGFEVSGNLVDVSAPFSIGENKVQKGAVTLYADKSGLSVKGPVNIGPWEADLAWREVFDNGATPTRFIVNGRLGQSDLDSFGIGLREFIGGGDVLLSIDAFADGIEITRADVTADLSETDMRVGPYWDKPKGTLAKMTGVLSLDKDGRALMRDFSLDSPGLDLKGEIDMGADYRLESLDFNRAKIAGFIDAAVQVKPNPDRTRFDVYMTGDYLDVSPFVEGTIEQSRGQAGNVIDVPILLTASLKQLALDETYVLQDANVLFAHNSEGITQARLKGLMDDEAFNVELSTNEAQTIRAVTVDIPNASRAVTSLFNIQSLTGGRLQLSADLPPVGVPGPLTGTVKVKDVTLVNAPVMTTMLSLASLQGLADALGGGGLKFQKLTIPFSYSDGLLSVREARASGPGLGMTSNGDISFDRKVVDLDGVLVPAYTANSLLGSIPLIGDIFVGKKGEGIFALNYTIGGPFEQAQVAVNPLSAMTPGFLRGIFATKRDELPEQLRENIEELRPQAEPQP